MVINLNKALLNVYSVHHVLVDFKAPFTRDRTNVYPDENSSGLLRLHGSAKKFVHLTFPFTRSKKFVRLHGNCLKALERPRSGSLQPK